MGESRLPKFLEYPLLSRE